MIKVENIKKYFGQKMVLDDINLDIEDGQVVTIIGPSGSGKSTLLRCMNLLEEPTSGEVYVDGQAIISGDVDINIVRSQMGMVFQHFNLFNNLNVIDNCVLAQTKVMKKSKAEAIKVAEQYLDDVGLLAFKDVKVSSLSGGQKQRVALARAVVINPDILLLDEALSNLDVKLRIQMRELIRKIQQEYKITTLFITHDQEECFAISDKVAVMNKGKLEQIATPEFMFSNPKNRFVADFIGVENIFEAKELNIESDSKFIGIRSKDISFTDEDYDIGELEVENKLYIAGRFKYTLKKEEMKLNVLSYDNLKVGDKVNIKIKQSKIIKLEE